MSINEKVFADIFSKPPEGNKKYIFLVDDEALDKKIIYSGYYSMLIQDKEDAERYMPPIIDGLTKGYVKDLVFLPAKIKKTMSDIFTAELENDGIPIDKEAYKIFYNKPYASWDDKQVKAAIDKYVGKYTTRRKEIEYNNNGFEMENGRISIKNLDFSKLALYLIKKYKIVKIGEHLHRYDSGLYVHLSDGEFDKIVMDEVYNTRIKDRLEFRRYVERYADEKTTSDKRYILFNNGIYDLKEKKLIPIKEDYVFCNRIPHNYNAEAERQDVLDSFISDLVCGDEVAMQFLKEVIGYCFYRGNPLQAFLFILGGGGNGKSTFSGFMEFLIGNDNISFLTLEEMADNFTLPQLQNKLLNIGDDVENEYISRVGPLKKMVSGEPFQAGGKYKDKKPMRYYGKLIFTGNTIPKMNDKTNGLKRRLKILPFLNDFRKKAVVNMLSKLCTEEVAEYAIKIGLENLDNVFKNGGFTIPPISKEALKAFDEKNNNVMEFIQEKRDFILAKEAQTVYFEYEDFCKHAGYKPLGRNSFYEAMENAGYKKVRDQTIPDRPTMFVKPHS